MSSSERSDEDRGRIWGMRVFLGLVVLHGSKVQLHDGRSAEKTRGGTAPPLAVYGCKRSYFSITKTVRRLRALPSGVALEATGCDSPYPLAIILLGSMAKFCTR